MQRTLVLIVAVATCGLALAADEPSREMNVTQGPESVFDRSPAEIMPALVGATPTGENGRVGSEFVFWGYRAGDGRELFLFACAAGTDVDCAARTQAVCPAGNAAVLETESASGNVVRRSCRAFSVTGPGDVRPGCEDRTESSGLVVGLVSCG
jgi:hypothetical protein